MFVVHVFIHVKVEKVEVFKAVSLENARNSVKEPGIARFDVLQQKDDPTRFVLVEVYRTADAPAKHKNTPHYARWRDAVVHMMAEPRVGVAGALLHGLEPFQQLESIPLAVLNFVVDQAHLGQQIAVGGFDLFVGRVVDDQKHQDDRAEAAGHDVEKREREDREAPAACHGSALDADDQVVAPTQGDTIARFECGVPEDRCAVQSETLGWVEQRDRAMPLHPESKRGVTQRIGPMPAQSMRRGRRGVGAGCLFARRV